MRRHPPRFTLFPYTTLFRSNQSPAEGATESPANTPNEHSKPRRFEDNRRNKNRDDRQPQNKNEQQIGRDTSELQSRPQLVCRLLLEKKKKTGTNKISPKWKK